MYVTPVKLRRRFVWDLINVSLFSAKASTLDKIPSPPSFFTFSPTFQASLTNYTFISSLSNVFSNTVFKLMRVVYICIQPRIIYSTQDYQGTVSGEKMKLFFRLKAGRARVKFRGCKHRPSHGIWKKKRNLISLLPSLAIMQII